MGETRQLIKKKKKTATKSKHPSSVERCEKVKLINKVEKESEKSIGKKRKKEKTCSIDAENAIEITIADNSNIITGEKKKKNKIDEKIALVDHHEDYADEDNCNQIVGEKKKKKLKKDKIEKEEQIVQVHHQVENAEEGTPKKAKKKKKNKNKNRNVTNEGETFSNKTDKAEENEVYHISSVDEDDTRGMKKWITQYHQTRPGLKVLQQQIDEFMTSHEAKLEQERKEREARDEADGWTVVSHHKGRKKTTDSESGITMGAVSLAAVSEFRDEKEKKLMKKKQTEALPEFYRFQRKEAQMNEILSLQSKFEQDKKKIQQLRAARKFRPY